MYVKNSLKATELYSPGLFRTNETINQQIFKFSTDRRKWNYGGTQGPVVQKPINANPRLKINQGVYFCTPKCFSSLIFGKSLH